MDSPDVRYIKTPMHLRRLERHYCIEPVLRSCLGSAQGNLLDVGTWDGSLITSIAPRYSKIHAMEPNARRFNQLLEMPGIHKPYHMDLETWLACPDRYNSYFDTITMTHVAYFFNDVDYCIGWACSHSDQLLVTLNSLDNQPGSRAHLKGWFGVGASNDINPIWVYEYVRHRMRTRIIWATLILIADCAATLEMLIDVVYFIAPLEGRNRDWIRRYLERYCRRGNEYHFSTTQLTIEGRHDATE